MEEAPSHSADDTAAAPSIAQLAPPAALRKNSRRVESLAIFQQRYREPYVVRQLYHHIPFTVKKFVLGGKIQT